MLARVDFIVCKAVLSLLLLFFFCSQSEKEQQLRTMALNALETIS
jgi:hypothetical protein